MTNIRYGATYVNPFPPRLGAHHALNPFRTGFTWHVSRSKGKEGTRVLNGKICNKASNVSMFYCTQDEHWTVTLQSYLYIYIKTITVRDKFVFYPQYLQLWRTYSIWDRNQSIPHKKSVIIQPCKYFLLMVSKVTRYDISKKTLGHCCRQECSHRPGNRQGKEPKVQTDQISFLVVWFFSLKLSSSRIIF